MEERLTRRDALGKWFAFTAAAAVAAMWPSRAEAANGDTVRLGGDNNADITTGISMTNATFPHDGLAVSAVCPPDGGGRAPSGINSRGSVGVRGISYGVKTNNDGLGEGPTGVLGIYGASTSTLSFGAAVHGKVVAKGASADDEYFGIGGMSDKGIGVLGQSGENLPSTLWWSNSANLKGIGVLGTGSRAGIMASSVAGNALDVRGKAVFSRSGRAAISAGRPYLDIKCPNLSTSSNIIATLQGSGGAGCAVAYCKRLSTTSFRVVLTKAATVNVYVAWFVLN